MSNRLVYIFLLIVFPISFAKGQESKDYLEAVNKFTNKEFKEASLILETIVEKEPTNDAAWYYYGLCDLNLGMKEGVDKLAKAVQLDSSNFWYKEQLASSYGLTGQYELAIDLYESLIKEYPQKSEIYYALVNLYMQEQEPDKAIDAITEIENKMGKNDATVMTKYNILIQQKRVEQAHESLKDYCEEYSSPQVLSVLGDYEMSMYNDSVALNYYNEALELDKDFAPARFGITETYRMTRKYSDYFTSWEAITEDLNIPTELKANYLNAVINQSDERFISNFKNPIDSIVAKSVKYYPSDTTILKTAGIWYYRTNNFDLAKDAFRKSMLAYPENIQATVNWIQMLSVIGDWDTMAEETMAAYKRFPQEVGFVELANAAHYNRKDYKSMIDNCFIILEASKGDVERNVSVLASLGDIYHLVGDRKAAYKAYESALKINPSYNPVLNNYAYYLSEEGRKLKKAYNMSKKTIESEPDNPTYLDTFGWILHLMGKDMEAKPFFKHAMLYGGKESTTVLDHYATVLEALGENDIAKVYRKQAQDKKQDEK